MSTNTKEQLELKKLTLTAWAKILLDNGTIDSTKYRRMVEKIDKLKA